MNDNDDPKGRRFRFGLGAGMVFVIPAWALFLWWFAP